MYMMKNDTNQVVLSDIERSMNIHPRLCTLHKWPHYNGMKRLSFFFPEKIKSLGYGIHLTWNENWRGLHIDDIEPNSPAESGGLLREDVVLAINGRSIEKEDFFAILSFIQHELAQDQIRLLVLDQQSAALAQRDQIVIDENNENCIRKETAKFTDDSDKSKKSIAKNMPDEPLDDMNKIPSTLIFCFLVTKHFYY